jgi:hypothetical protein
MTFAAPTATAGNNFTVQLPLHFGSPAASQR